MQTTHRTVCGDARELTEISDSSVELVVTSPPYPLIEMWDEMFASQSNRVDTALRAEDGQEMFRGMHRVLDDVWSEVARVLVDGGIACINIGDATRKVNDEFQVYPNHSRVIDAFRNLGFNVLPGILWRKPANSLAKFMGSGMRPPNAYTTLEHEYILIFRNGGLRQPDPSKRDTAAYFWEERNEWFSDTWTDINGITQNLDDADRERSGAFPLEIPYRLINMFSVHNDTVLDPFLGTGTTTIAAMCAGRNSIGCDVDSSVLELIDDRIKNIQSLSQTIGKQRLENHIEFVEQTDRDFKYTSNTYDFPVTTSGEKDIKLYQVQDVKKTEAGFTLTHDSMTDQ